ncbi:MAG: hypothetical protein U0228_11060 [Myxococcaceae bacterium]
MPRTLARLTDRLTLGDSLLVSPVCLGMVTDPRVVLDAWEAGINFFFVTADMHWPLYAPLREGLATLLQTPGVRDHVVVCGTAYVTQPDFCELPFQELVDAVPGLERLDVVTMGGVYAVDYAARLEVYRRHRATGFVGCRAIGASFHERKVARAALVAGDVDCGFVRMNPAHPGAASEVLPAVAKLARDERPRVFNFKSMDAWDGSTEATDHYRFAMSHEGVDGVLASFASKQEVRALARALAAGPLSARERNALIKRSR